MQIVLYHTTRCAGVLVIKFLCSRFGNFIFVLVDILTRIITYISQFSPSFSFFNFQIMNAVNSKNALILLKRANV